MRVHPDAWSPPSRWRGLGRRQGWGRRPRPGAAAYTLGGVGNRFVERVERRLTDTTDPALVQRLWAHVSLRLVDWPLRPRPESVERWLAVAARYL
jgi:hypothetical protein